MLPCISAGLGDSAIQNYLCVFVCLIALTYFARSSLSVFRF